MTGAGRFRRLVIFVAAGLSVLVACGQVKYEDPAPDPQVTAADSPVRFVDGSEADLVLHISNQSTEHEVVRLAVTIDGFTVVDGNFASEGQHNVVTYPLAMSPRTHELVAESDSGSTLRDSFEVDGDETRYALIERWTDEGQAELTWLFQRDQMFFG